MSIATEITRLRNAKAALKESIEAKGVTVEDTAKLDEYPALVDAIQQSNIPSFGGLEISPGPLCYINGEYGILMDWNHNSYNNIYGKNEGSTYFSYVEIGQLFEKSDFSINDGDINNVLNPFNGWRLPTLAEWNTLTTGNSPGTIREGSKVNDNTGVRFTNIIINTSNMGGILLFPDKKIINGKVLTSINGGLYTNMTDTELQNYLNQGCIFLPCSGWYEPNSWNDNLVYGVYMSSTQDTNYYKNYNLEVGKTTCNFTKINKSNMYSSVYLVRSN